MNYGWLVAVALGTVGCAPKVGTDGVPLKVYVLNGTGDPIPTAVVRHPDEADRHRVNAATGHWEGSVLYMEDGSELIFMPNTTIQLEVSAPGFLTKVIQYDIKKRRNQFDVQLDQLSLKEDEFEEPIIQFGHDKKKSELGGGAAN
jgi:hypothetical protein